MTSSLPLFFNTSQLILFFSVFAILYLIKRLSKTRQQIIINGIWFSEDGSIAEEAVNNLVALVKKINTYDYSQSYKVFLWTDREKLQAKPEKILHSHGITIKDYRSIHPKDEASKKINAWVNDFIQLGNQDNKFFYCLASDLFRLYLLLKEFPENYNNAVTCYIDCNDIDILALPHPSAFQALDSVAFNFGYLNYTNILKELIGYITEPQPYFNNDVILVANKRNKNLLNTLFTAYFDNLNVLDERTAGLVEKLNAMRKVIAKPDQNLALVIVFAITHMTNIFRLKDDEYDTFLFEHKEAGLNIKRLKDTDIDFASFYIDFERNLGNGFTWGKIPKAENPDTDLESQHRQFWYTLYAQRYHLINNTLNKEIASSNIALFL